VKEFRDKTAVVTGAAGGIGRALARRCGAAGMRVTLADIDREALAVTAAELRAAGVEVLAVVADVSCDEDVERVAGRTLDKFGSVHLLFNNAGVGLIGPTVWESTPADWEWLFGVNLRGVVNSVRAFVPPMLRQQTEGHIVNTASAAGLLSPPGMGPYSASKAAVVSLSEALRQELRAREARIEVSVLCPGLVKSRLIDAARNRPERLRNNPAIEADRRTRYLPAELELRREMREAMEPETLARRTFDAIVQDRFLVLTHSWVADALEGRVRSLLRQEDPPPPRGPGFRGPR